MFTLGAPGYGEMAIAALAAFVIGYAIIWGLDRLLLRRLIADRIAAIALLGALSFLLMMALGSAYFTHLARAFSAVGMVLPSIEYVFCFLGGTFAAGGLRMALYTREYEHGDDELVFEPDYDDLSRYDDELNAWDEKNRGRSYFRRHWAGHLPLTLSYWVNGALISVLILAGTEWIAHKIRGGWGSLQALAAVGLLYLVVSTLVWVWSSVGIWRSAYWHRRRGGSAGWGYAARVLVLLSVLGVALRSGDAALQAAEFGRLARGEDSIGAIADMRPSADGSEVVLRGNIAIGAADKFAAVLAAAPKARTLVLTSPGGRILEAERIAEAVRARGLDTRVDDACMSACTEILLAGRSRSAPARARIGFHQPDFPGLTRAERWDATREMHDRYLAAGVKDAFVDRAMAAPPQAMWFPTAEEMMQANVLTGHAFANDGGASTESLGGRRLRLDFAATARQLNAAAGRAVDPVTTFQHAEASGLTLTQHYRLKLDRIDVARVRPQALAVARRNICGDAASATAVADGGRFTIVYEARTGRRLFDVTVDRCGT